MDARAWWKPEDPVIFLTMVQVLITLLNPLCSHLLISGEALFKSLNCDDLDLYSSNHTLPAPLAEEVPTSAPPLWESNNSVPLPTPEVLVHVSTHTPWLLTSLVLMELNAYFPQVSPMSSLSERLSQ
ncbi:hypothetical protein DSO57_1007780 [Entomophthora muscae]|uniref:Uncharacterized protein n=1 Tax=Entomophthora muscae TaxID=34485 RepID=A0ACC2RM14_9FUNG|nr:hypothetical protein DSO57_1007780 [Entomophthora muscae]